MHKSTSDINIAGRLSFGRYIKKIWFLHWTSTFGHSSSIRTSFILKARGRESRQCISNVLWHYTQFESVFGRICNIVCQLLQFLSGYRKLWHCQQHSPTYTVNLIKGGNYCCESFDLHTTPVSTNGRMSSKMLFLEKILAFSQTSKSATALLIWIFTTFFTFGAFNITSP